MVSLNMGDSLTQQAQEWGQENHLPGRPDLPSSPQSPGTQGARVQEPGSPGFSSALCAALANDCITLSL